MTSDFKSGKAYLIEGKGIEQVKQGIKEWLAKNNIEMLMKSEDLIEAHDYGFFNYYEFYFLVKLVENPEGTLVVFSDKTSKNIFYSRNFLEPLPSVLLEKRKDMIRFLNGKEELNVDMGAYARLSIFTYIPLSLIAILLLFYIDFYIIFLIFMPISLLLTLFDFVLFPRQITKNKNLPEYNVEEYTGEIKID